MSDLQVRIEINGVQHKVGTIQEDGRRKGIFSCHKDYLSWPGAVPISVALPLCSRPFSEWKARLFFVP